MHEFGKCDKHHCGVETREMDGGKTMQVCPVCEQERSEFMRKLFGAPPSPQETGK